MKRNHLLRSILLTCVCLLFASFAHEALAQKPATEGTLRAVDAQGQPTGRGELDQSRCSAAGPGFPPECRTVNRCGAIALKARRDRRKFLREIAK